MPELGKIKVTAGEVAEKLMKLVATPKKQDEIFREEVVVSCPGIDLDTYNLECFCLGVFAGLVAARTVLEPAAWDKFIEQYSYQLHLYVRNVLNERELMNVALDRIQIYAAASDSPDKRQRVRGIEQMFSELCCGDPSNRTLHRIGGSIYSVRADRSVGLLKTFDVRL
jgi:hypothetical protein